MDFWNIFLELCNKIGKAPNTVAKELGISSGSISAWKQNPERKPQSRMVKKIADYFGVSDDYLLGYEQQKNIPQDVTASEDEMIFLELFRKLSPEKRQMLINMLKIALAD